MTLVEIEEMGQVRNEMRVGAWLRGDERTHLEAKRGLAPF